MDDPPLFRPLAVVLGGIFVGLLAWTFVFDKLRSVPGPFLARFTSLWKFYIVWAEQMPWTNAELHEKYGPLVRIGPNHVSASNLEALQTIHVKGKGFQKTKIYNLLQPQYEGAPLHNVFSTQDQQYHTRLKRNIGGLYTMSAMTKVEANISRSITKFMTKLRGFTQGSTAVVDMSAWLQFFAFDCIGEINFSQSLGFMDSGRDIDGICELDHEMMMYFALWGQIPTTERLLAKTLTWTRAMKPNPLFQFTLDLVEQRLATPNTEQKDMLDAFIDIHRKAPDKMSLREVIGAAYINVVTAHDVLAISLRAMLYHLWHDQTSYRRLVDEITTADAAGELSCPAQYSEIIKLPFLSAVVNEALRIHPSTGTILERYVPEGGTVINGLYIPEGTTIGVNAWVMNRNKDIFGDDVECFRPDRWLDGSPEKIATMKRGLLTWGAGARNCIGKNMATMQILKVITELYRNFDIELHDKNSKWKVSGGWLTRQTAMDMELTERCA